jgi:hypothetical protein
VYQETVITEQENLNLKMETLIQGLGKKGNLQEPEDMTSQMELITEEI